MKIFIIFAFVALTSARSYSPSSEYGHSIQKPVGPHNGALHGYNYGSNEGSGHYNHAHAMPYYSQKPLYSDYKPHKPKASVKPVDVPVIRIHYGLPEFERHAPTQAPFSSVFEHAPVIQQHKTTTNTKTMTNFNRVNGPTPIPARKNTRHPVAIHKELPKPTTLVPAPKPKSAPAPAPFIPTLRFDEEIKEGSYHSFEFEAANGIHQKENTSIVYLPESEESSRQGKSYTNYNSYDSDKYNYEQEGRALITKTGSYSYISPEGKHIHMSYVADKDGFRPLGDHIPTSPPLPEANVRAAAAHFAALSRANMEEPEDAEVEHDHHDHDHDHDAAGKHAEHAAQAVHAAHASHALPHEEEFAMAAREAQEEHRVRSAYAHSSPVRH